MKKTFLAFCAFTVIPLVAWGHPGHSPTDGEFGPRHYLSQPDHLVVFAAVAVSMVLLVIAIRCLAKSLAAASPAE